LLKVNKKLIAKQVRPAFEKPNNPRGFFKAEKLIRNKSADTIRVRVNVYHSIKDRIHDCISTYLAKNFEITSCKTGGVHTGCCAVRM
jgi:hypothetical protein